MDVRKNRVMVVGPMNTTSGVHLLGHVLRK